MSLDDAEGANRRDLIQNFATITNTYLAGVHKIGDIFMYMDRAYLQPKFQTDVKTKLLERYSIHVEDCLVKAVMKILATSQQETPRTISPAVIQSLLCQGHVINPTYFDVKII